ncbi:733f9685-ac51-42a0-bf82-501ebcb9e58f [Thermothielavioides terrestris]|uniref:Squalene monooxygenase n=2 Tax=Thermothielavioides terrestris TaxID=2587410 RepID=G2R6D3_THETT|nr:squalene epoxidase [Thermothielavioides terrestris NRRL 8126]AEO67618.1 squalene epoxidase [Thermothielavioides terrestris NRRL 8126]SPQ25743.1 733f9685-ac51-42a0-bf82-501ebcb9e58f [Thermothielavioides terrestris]
MPPAFDVLVVGAGVAGCAIATAFARQGRHVLVVERNLAEPDRIVGELLQPGGVAAIAALGLSHCLDGIEATPVKGYHLFWKDEQAAFWFCPFSGSNNRVLDTPGSKPIPPTGRSFHHGKFIERLRASIAAEPNVTLLEATALELLRDETTGAVVGAACARTGDSPAKHYASLTVLADGSCSNFRSLFTPHRPKAQSRFWGLELVDARLPRHGYAFAVLGQGPPILMYQIGARETRILIDIPHDKQRQLRTTASVRRYIQQHVVPIVPESVRPSLEKAAAQGRLRSMPNAWMPASRSAVPGLVMLGDAANMRHPITGAGMTVALKDAVLLSQLLSPEKVPFLGNSGAVRKAVRGFHWRRKAHSATLNILALALYLLFVSEDPSLIIMQRGFIRYVQEGEKNFAEPAWLMGGLVDSPFLLFYHFFMVALYSIRLHLGQAGWLGVPKAVLQSTLVFASAVGIIWRPIVDELRQ